MDHAELLQRLTINAADVSRGSPLEPRVLAAREIALVRLAALIAVDAPDPSYGAQVDDAVAAGVSSAEVVDVLAAVAPIVGVPHLVAAAPRISIALGLEPVEGWVSRS